jgi:excisionase family DNA binding protein
VLIANNGDLLMDTTDTTADARRTYTIAEFCQKYQVGRNSFYNEVSAGRLKVVRVGRRVLVRVDDAETWLAALVPGKSSLGSKLP